jgi:hypothetical protein
MLAGPVEAVDSRGRVGLRSTATVITGAVPANAGADAVCTDSHADMWCLRARSASPADQAVQDARGAVAEVGKYRTVVSCCPMMIG